MTDTAKTIAMTPNFHLYTEVSTTEEMEALFDSKPLHGTVLFDYTGRQYMLIHTGSTDDQITEALDKEGWI